jgi:hypothetical protein
MAINNKPADTYSKPHTMDGKMITGNEVMEAGVYAHTKSAKDVRIKDPLMNGVSYGTDTEVKTSGVVTRGNGCATKGITARGSMA